MNDPIARARQHLMVQGCTLYTCEAAVAMLLLKSATLRDPRHAFAVEMDKRSLPLTALLTDEHEPPQLVEALRHAAVLAAEGGPMAVCSAGGGIATAELTTNAVRGILVRTQLSAATDPADALDAVPEDELRRALQRRLSTRGAAVPGAALIEPE